MGVSETGFAHTIRRTGLVRWLWVLLATVGITLWGSVQVLWRWYRGTLTREIADERIQWWSRRLLDLVDLQLRVHDNGFRFEPDQAYVLMCNHASHYDIPITFQSVPGSIRMIAKKELFYVPVLSAAMRATEFISIDRSNRTQAMRDLKFARRKMAQGLMIWISPEGTRSRSGRLGRLKKGGFMLALETDAIILPIGIRGAGAILPPDSLSIRLGCQVDVHYGTPVRASDYGVQQREVLMAEVERQLLHLAAVDREPDPRRPD